MRIYPPNIAFKISASFGSPLIGRTYQAESLAGYRFGFGGQEKTDELNGSDNSLEFEYRIYDSRLGRFLSVDPLTKEYPWNSTYAFAENDVIRCIDLEGCEKVALSGFVPPKDYGQGNTYNSENVKAFKAQGERLNKIYGYSNYQVSTGSEIIDRLVNETKAHGPITNVAFFLHSGPVGFYMKDKKGFYFDQADILKSKIQSKQIVFSKDAVIFINGCNSASTALAGANNLPSPYAIAQKLCLTTKTTVIAAKDGHMEMVDPNNANGEFKISDKDKEGYFVKLTIVQEKYTEQKPNPDYHWYNALWTDKEITVEKTRTVIKEENLGRNIKVDDYAK